jgi:hypothetical protein
MNRAEFASLSLSYPQGRDGQSCHVVLYAMLREFDKKWFVSPYDNHGVVMGYDPFSQKYLIECTGISAPDPAWFDPSELDFVP